MAKKFIDADVFAKQIYKRLNNSAIRSWLFAIINEMPAADVQEVRHGKWAGTVCTNCGESTSDYYDCDYCPHCGSKMIGELD